MNELYKDFLNLQKTGKVLSLLLLLLSIPYKFFFITFQKCISGPDAAEYIYLAGLFKKSGILGYIQSNDPVSLWRIPTLPFALYVTQTLFIFYVAQLLFTYILAYNFYKIIKYITKHQVVSLICFFSILFLPYLNNAACAPLTEFMQVSFIIYVLRKVLYKHYDWRLFLALSAFCLLRAEAQYFVFFLIIRELFLKQYTRIFLYGIPVCIVLLWCARNKSNFGAFSLVNPVLSSRAMIGSLYGYIYMENRNEFHAKYDYYNGKDYVNNKKFIEDYQKVVRLELKHKLLHEPFDYARIRIMQIARGFLYFGFNLEQLPDKDWKYKKDATFEEISANNSEWAYGKILENRDYAKLCARLLYNGGLAMIHLFGVLFIFLNYRKLLPLLFVLLNFCFILIVEVDMRYLITIQSISVCAFIVMCYSIFNFRTLKLNWIQ